jgi:Flp pilus assembly pilin Flp
MTYRSHNIVAGIRRVSPGRVSAGPGGPERSSSMERVRQFTIRLYLAATELRDREEGQTLVEYALILALVSVTAVAALQALSGGINGIFSQIVSDL